MAEATNLSEECDPLLCYPCSVGGKSRSPHGFCDTCKHHLCESCFKVHCVPLICRDHVMLDQVSMPKDKVVPRDPLTEKCEKHGHLLEYYCKKHKDILCNVCVTLNHGYCGVSFIPDESKDIGNSQEYSSLRDNVSDLIRKVKKNKEMTVGNKAYIEKLKEDTRSQVRHMKEELVRFFDKLELSLIRKIDHIAEKDVSVMDKLSQCCIIMEADLQKLFAELDEKLNKNQNNKLFVTMKKTEKKMAEVQLEIESMHSRNRVTWYRFEPDVEFERVKSSFISLGKLHVRRHDHMVKAKHVRNIKVKSKSEKGTCYISSICVLDQNKMVVCDSNNYSVKLIDTKGDESQVRFPFAPWDMALVPCDVTEESTTRDLIVTLPVASSIHYLRVTGNQITDTNNAISVEGQCLGIQVTLDRKLVVSYVDPAKVEIMEMDGRVLRRLPTDPSGTKLFCQPNFLAVSPCSGIIHVSDWGNNKLTSVRTRDGSVMTKLKGLESPRGVTVDKAGSVFVCCGRTVHLVAATGDWTTQILGKEDGLLWSPRAISLSPESDRIYVGGWRNDHVQEYQLT